MSDGHPSFRRLLRPLLLGLSALLVLGCLTSCTRLLGGTPKIQQKRRFIIPVEPIRGGLKTSERPYDATVQLRRFDIAGAYDQSEIVVRDSRYELRRDRLHTWSQRPAAILTDAVGEYLRQAGLFTRLVSDRDLLDREPDYLLSGSVTALERIDSGDRWFARLVLSMQLVRQSDSRVIWRGTITPDDEIEVFDPDMKYTVQGVSEVLRRGMQQFVREIDFIFLGIQRSGGLALVESLGMPDSLRASRTALAAPEPAAGDTASYYEILPGKLAPE